MNENLTGARVVKAFGQEEQEMNRFSKSNTRVRDAEVDVANYDCRFSALYYLIEDFLTFLVWALGSAMIISGSDMELGLLITFSGYVGQLKWPLEFMSRIFRWYTSAMNSAQRMFEIMDAVPEVKESPDPVRPESLRGEIELKNVTFGYDEHVVLDHLNFQVKTGEQVTLSGRTGAGKSTIMKLLLGLYEPQSGEILLRGVPVTQIQEEDRRNIYGYVEQTFHMVPGTVRDQITLYDPRISDQQVKAVTEPELLLLDEITANLDSVTEKRVLDVLRRASDGRTVISISHRIHEKLQQGRLIHIGE